MSVEHLPVPDEQVRLLDGLRHSEDVLQVLQTGWEQDYTDGLGHLNVSTRCPKKGNISVSFRFQKELDCILGV